MTFTHGAVWRYQWLAIGIKDIALELSILFCATAISRIEEAGWYHMTMCILFYAEEEWHICELFSIILEVRNLAVKIIFFQDYVAHGHSQSRISTGLNVEPSIGRSSGFSIVRRYRNHLGSLVAHFIHEVRIWSPRQWNIGTPGDDIARIKPVTRLRGVRLFAPHLWRCRRQISIPVVEGQRYPAHEVEETSPCCIGQLGHGWDYGETKVTIWAIGLCCVEHRCSDYFGYFFPSRPHKAPHTPLRCIGCPLNWISYDRLPSLNSRSMLLTSLPPKISQNPAHIWILNARWAVEVPGEGRSTGTTTWFVIRHIIWCSRVVCSLVFPCDDTVLYINVPGTGASTVNTMCGTYSLVIRPTIPVEGFPLTATLFNLLMTRLRLLSFSQKLKLLS